MPIKYVLRKSVSAFGPNKGEFVYSAQPAKQDEISFNILCERIASESTIDCTEVKTVIDQLVCILSEELPEGKTIQIGELGSFRLSFGSTQCLNPERFSADMIQGHRLVFSPGEKLKDIPARGKLPVGSSPDSFSYKQVRPLLKKKPCKPKLPKKRSDVK